MGKGISINQRILFRQIMANMETEKLHGVDSPNSGGSQKSDVMDQLLRDHLDRRIRPRIPQILSTYYPVQSLFRRPRLKRAPMMWRRRCESHGIEIVLTGPRCSTRLSRNRRRRIGTKVRHYQSGRRYVAPAAARITGGLNSCVIA